jgi:HD-GYP domain-containing protein (c-di-GMP phosphodiesterase class II)
MQFTYSSRLRWLFSLAVPLVLIAAGWHTIISQSRSLEHSTIVSYQAAQTEIVESTARAAVIYITRELQRRGTNAISAIEQEVLHLFVQPIRIGTYGDAWIYSPEYAIFDQSADFPAELLGMSIRDIFALRSHESSDTRPAAYAGLVEGVSRGQPGVTTYIWQPHKAAEYAPWWETLTQDSGWEIASWTKVVVFPGTAEERIWIIGMSSMLTEAMHLNGAYAQIHGSILIMIAVTISTGIVMFLFWRRDRAWQVAELQRLNNELTRAYDATITGLVHVLEWRDAETEGHCQRVTNLTLRLARAMNVPEAELVHLRRGAILHDIGKLAIPDSVLLKPDRLTDEEYAIMKRHTRYAHAMLAPISFLRPALDIPRFHHEKWDGTGYPHGLRGTQIPLAARIFAVIDVYDALCSDRPYRAGWPPERVCAYIAAHAGTHFDPEIVDVFLSQVVHVPAPECPMAIIPET